MTVNRVIPHLDRADKQESRYVQAVRWRAQAQSVIDRIEAVVGEEPVCARLTTGVEKQAGLKQPVP